MSNPNARECEHGRQRGHCADCDVVELEGELAEIREEIQRLLRWTREKPTVPGWYWMQSKTQSATIVRIDTSVDDNLCVDGLEDFDCEAWQDDLGTMAGGEWAGPIPAPGERS